MSSGSCKDDCRPWKIEIHACLSEADNTPTSRLISPRVAPEQRNADALGRTLETLYAYGVTELYSLIAATAAQRLGLAPRFTHLDSTSFHVDGR